jgi:glycosyltransferase involved in cell wall biosynthesis
LDETERRELGVPVLSAERTGKADLAFFPRLLAALHAQRPQIVHAHLHAGKYAGRFAAWWSRVPALVFTEHGDDLSGPLNSLANRFLHPRTARFITFSEFQRRDFAARERVPLAKISVIPNGVPAAVAVDRQLLRGALGLPAEAFILYLPARMVPLKNHALVLQALAEIRAQGLLWHVAFAGSGPSEAALRALSESLGIAPHVTFLGFRDDAAALFGAMDALVMPSEIERMPLALLEAMRAGIPVVTTPWPGFEEFVRDGDTGFVAHDSSLAALIAVLLRLAGESERRLVASRAKAFADEHFDLATMVQRHVALYETLARASV